MDHSYLYTKRFIDAQVKILNRPLQLDAALKNVLARQHELGGGGDSELTEAQLARVIDKINVRMRRHNSNAFSSQVVHRVVQQVLKLEQTKFAQVNEQLVRARTVLRPVLLPEFEQVTNLSHGDRLREFGQLVHELPESKYLLVGDMAQEGEPSDSDDTSDDNGLVQDEQQRVEPALSRKKARSQQVREIAAEVKNKMDQLGIKQMVETYEELRLSLIELHSSLVYKIEKKQYLEGLKHELEGLVDQSPESDHEDEEPGVTGLQANLVAPGGAQDGLGSEINRFRILVEKLAYKLNHDSTSARSLIHEINHQ